MKGFKILNMGAALCALVFAVSAGCSPGKEDPMVKAFSDAKPGDTVYIEGGNYRVEMTIDLVRSGSASAPINIFAKPGTSVTLDFGRATGSNGLNISGNYYHIKGFEIINAPKSGVRINGNCNTIENCSIHNNNDAGLYIGENKDDKMTFVQDGSYAAYNQIINCDSYLNCDSFGSTGPGGNADGFACKLNPGTGNVFTGCRSWENSDDGWDCYMADYPVTLINCITWHNGDPNSFGYTGSNWGGNGNGFKMGGGDSAKTGEHYSHGQHVLKNCIGFDIAYGKGTSHKAFDRNNNHAGVTMINCLAFNSNIGYSFSSDPDAGYGNHTFINCVAFGNSTDYSVGATTNIVTTCSWTGSLGLTVTAADFVDITIASAKAARNSDGSLPMFGTSFTNNFGHLAVGSQLVDKGTVVSGMTATTFLGGALDLGAIECY